MTNDENLLYNFYTTERNGEMMRDGGGAFGFDIHHALEIDYLIRNYKCDSIIETGTHFGDTTSFLAKTYPHLDIITCETQRNFYDKSKARLSKFDNVEVVYGSSEKVIENYLPDLHFPLIYLDAHWEDYWPLQDEIKNITHGIVCVGDFNIKHMDYGFDSYNDVDCDLSFLREHLSTTNRYDCPSKIYCNNPNSVYRFPLMANQSWGVHHRLGGRAYYFEGIDMTGKIDFEAVLDKGANFSIAK